MLIKASRKDKINKIQEIAFSLFLDRGYEATSMRNICKAAGIEQPTLYYFFGSKEGLFFSVINRLWDQYKQFNTVHARKMETLPPEEKLYGIFRGSVGFGLKNRRSAAFYYRYSLFPPAGLEKKIRICMAKMEEEPRLQVRHAIGELIGQGQIERDQKDAERTYCAFVGNQIFNVIFSDYRPEESDLKKQWNMFYKCWLQKNCYNV